MQIYCFKASFPKQKIENINIEDLSKYMLARSRGLYEIYDSIKADLKENDLYKFLVDLWCLWLKFRCYGKARYQNW